MDNSLHFVWVLLHNKVDSSLNDKGIILYLAGCVEHVTAIIY